MGSAVKVFVSYSHEDKKYLAKRSLLGYLRGLEQDGVEFWTDQQIKAGQLWDEVIKTQIQLSDIALVLVSQAFLDSKYCQDVEIKQFLAQTKYLFPVILSPCEWQRHDWLARRQFLPGGDKTIETHYKSTGDRKGLFLDIRTQLRDIIHSARLSASPAGAEPSVTPAQTKANYGGDTRFALQQRLGNNWRDLAMVLEIPQHEQRRFTPGDEAYAILQWLENCDRLHELPQALISIGRSDLAEIFTNPR